MRKKQHHKHKLVTAAVECALFVALLGLVLSSFVYPARPSYAVEFRDPLLLPVGGAFAPGVFDIYTPSFCGPLVTVIGPKGGTFVFAPVMVYRHFAETPVHIGTNVIGMARIIPGVPCPPTLYMLGSSRTPGM